jgi:S-adenosylmethionine/arginine decarboxylase-like enzyme
VHVTVDIEARPRTARKRWTAQAANAFIDRAIAITGLRAIAERQVAERGDVLMFYQLIAESHISGHLDRRHGRGWVDVFSCRPLEARLVQAAASKYLGADGTISLRCLDRGVLP